MLERSFLAMGLLAACQAPPADRPEHGPPRPRAAPVEAPRVEPAAPPDLQPLARSLGRLRQDFNAHSALPRLVTLISPSCTHAARAVEAVLAGLPEGEFHVSVIWIDQLAGDGPASALRAGETLADPRVSFFHDGHRRAARAFARGLLPVTAAEDVYLFYPSGAVWDEEPPRPVAWTHQLGRLSPAHFACQEELGDALQRSMVALLDPE